MSDKFINSSGLTAIKNWLITKLNAKQNTLVSGSNVKTVGGNSIVGSGNAPVGHVIRNAYPTEVDAGVSYTIDLTSANGTSGILVLTFINEQDQTLYTTPLSYDNAQEFSQNYGLALSMGSTMYYGVFGSSSGEVGVDILDVLDKDGVSMYDPSSWKMKLVDASYTYED